jgi:hypothetical protein
MRWGGGLIINLALSNKLFIQQLLPLDVGQHKIMVKEC